MVCPKTLIVIGKQVAAAQCFPHDPRRVEWMRMLAHMLQNQDVRAIVDFWNRVAEAK